MNDERQRPRPAYHPQHTTPRACIPLSSGTCGRVISRKVGSVLGQRGRVDGVIRIWADDASIPSVLGVGIGMDMWCGAEGFEDVI